MFGSRPLALSLVMLTLAAGLALGRTAHAQESPATQTTQVPGSLTASGSYSAKVSTSGSGFFERAGTYQASVSFTAAVSVSGVNILVPSGSYQASGPFTATVSAPGVTPFTVTGTYTAAGTFAAGTFVSSGQWVVNTGGNASGSHSGGGTYNLTTMTAVASGQYDGAVTSSPRGPFNVQGPYSGAGSFTVGVMWMTEGNDPLTSALSDIIAGIAGQAVTGPVAAAALEMQNTTTPPAGSAVGTFATGTVAPSGVSIVSFTGTTAQLNTAGTAAQVVTVSATVGGKMLSYVIGAPAFVNTDFNVAFPAGLNGTLVIVKT